MDKKIELNSSDRNYVLFKMLPLGASPDPECKKCKGAGEAREDVILEGIKLFGLVGPCYYLDGGDIIKVEASELFNR